MAEASERGAFAQEGAETLPQAVAAVQKQDLQRGRTLESLATFLTSGHGLAGILLAMALELGRTSGSIDWQSSTYHGSQAAVLCVAMPLAAFGVLRRKRWGFSLAAVTLILMAAAHPLWAGESRQYVLAGAFGIGAVLCGIGEFRLLIARGPTAKDSWSELCTWAAVLVIGIPLCGVSIVAGFGGLATSSRTEGPLGVALGALGGWVLLGLAKQRAWAMIASAAIGLAVIACVVWGLTTALPLGPFVAGVGRIEVAWHIAIPLGLLSLWVWASWRLAIEGALRVELRRPLRRANAGPQ